MNLLRSRRNPLPLPRVPRKVLHSPRLENHIQEINENRIDFGEISDYSSEWTQDEIAVLFENRLKRSSRRKMTQAGDLQSLNSADEGFKEQIASVGHRDSWKFISDSDVSKYRVDDDTWHNFEHVQDAIVSRVRIPRDISDVNISLVQDNTTNFNALEETPEIVPMKITEIIPKNKLNNFESSNHYTSNDITEEFSESVNSSKVEKAIESSPVKFVKQESSGHLNTNNAPDGNKNSFYFLENESIYNDSNMHQEKNNISIFEIAMEEKNSKQTELVTKSVDLAENSTTTHAIHVPLLKSGVVKDKQDETFILEIANIATGLDNETKSSPSLIFTESPTTSNVSSKSTNSITESTVNSTVWDSNKWTKIENKPNSILPVVNSVSENNTDSSSKNKTGDYILENCAHGKHRRKNYEGGISIDNTDSELRTRNVSNLDSFEELDEEFISDPEEKSIWRDMSTTIKQFAVDIFYVFKNFTKRAVYSTAKILRKAGQTARRFLRKVGTNLSRVPIINRTIVNVDTLQNTNMSFVDDTASKIVDTSLDVARNATSKVTKHNRNLYNHIKQKLTNKSDRKLPVRSAFNKVEVFYLGN